MRNTLHPTIPDTRINLARHEAAHFWLAHLLGFQAHDLILNTDGGSCTIIYPMWSASFAETYAKSPIQAARWLVQILAVVRIGTYAELHGGQYGAELHGPDLADTEAWRAAVVPLYGSDGWNSTYASMFQSLQTWYRYAQVQAVIREVAVPIAYQDAISRFQMLSLLEVSGAGLAPDPFFDTILAPARREPSSQTVPLTASVRRRVELPTRGASRPTTAAVAPPAPRPVRTGSIDEYHVYGPLEQRGAYSLHRLEHKRSKRELWVVVSGTGKQAERWEYATPEAAVGQLDALAPIVRGRKVQAWEQGER